MYNAVSLPNAENSNTDLIGGWRTIFLLVEFLNLIVLLIAMGLWFRKSDQIEQSVNDDQLKPSDYTVEVHYIPKKCDEGELKDKLVEMFEGKVKRENIHVVKKLDEFVGT